MRRMSKLASILDKSILADDEGNIEAKKDVKIDGNLKFKSLVSNDNPDGIFDPSSGGTGGGGTGGTIHGYLISIGDMVQYEAYSTEDFGGKINSAQTISNFWTSAKYQTLRNNGIYPSSGIYITEDKSIVTQLFEIKLGVAYLNGYDIKANSRIRYGVSTDLPVKLAKMY